MKISAATIDRMFAETRKRYRIKGRSTTRPGSLLKKSIPIRTFADWDEKVPGFFEVDLVSHDGGAVRGDFIQSLNFTDISTFTRSRPYRKNDSCFVEQKNYSVIRRTVGYSRYDTDNDLTMLNELYNYLRPYVNFFQPVRKLIKKEKIGSKIIKRYDEAKTPYRRVLSSSYISKETKVKLKSKYDMLNSAELKRKITKLQNRLLKLNALKQEMSKEKEKDMDPFVYIST